MKSRENLGFCLFTVPSCSLANVLCNYNLCLLGEHTDRKEQYLPGFKIGQVKVQQTDPRTPRFNEAMSHSRMFPLQLSFISRKVN